MDNKLFEELLQEIDTMTSEEYWSLYREAEKLVSFPPENTSFYPVKYTNIPVKKIDFNFDNTFNAKAISITHNYNQETFFDGDDIWQKVA